MGSNKKSISNAFKSIYTSKKVISKFFNNFDNCNIKKPTTKSFCKIRMPLSNKRFYNSNKVRIFLKKIILNSPRDTPKSSISLDIKGGRFLLFAKGLDFQDFCFRSDLLDLNLICSNSIHSSVTYLGVEAARCNL